MMLFIEQQSWTDFFEQMTLFETFTETFFLRLALDLTSVFILIRLIYYRIYHKADLFMTFFTFNLVIFLITFLFNQVQMSIGAAFGLFAVFSMLRYRTEGLSAKDMTYLFLVIALGLIPAVTEGSWEELILICGIILLGVQLLEGNWLIRREHSKVVLYDQIELIAPHRRTELLRDLRTRTGLHVHRVEIESIDFIRDSAKITIYFHNDDEQQDVSYENKKKQELTLSR